MTTTVSCCGLRHIIPAEHLTVDTTHVRLNTPCCNEPREWPRSQLCRAAWIVAGAQVAV